MTIFSIAPKEISANTSKTFNYFYASPTTALNKSKKKSIVSSKKIYNFSAKKSKAISIKPSKSKSKISEKQKENN